MIDDRSRSRSVPPVYIIGSRTRERPIEPGCIRETRGRRIIYPFAAFLSAAVEVAEVYRVRGSA